jgi:transaldolase
MLEMYANPLIKGFTTNPTLLRKAGVQDYEAFAKDIIKAIPDRSLSFEVFSDDFTEMEKQARYIRSWGENVYVKIPVTNSQGVSSAPLIQNLAKGGVKQNVTALTDLSQVETVAKLLAGGPPAYISVFAGRVADTGRDPVPIMAKAVEILAPSPNIELIWASPRELFNVFQANAVGCHIITATNDILKKIPLVGKDLLEYSLETVKMFQADAEAAGYKFAF